MDWIRNLNNALQYIEDNLQEEIESHVVANVAYCSQFHFLRVFKILTGKTLGEYIRERRLSFAAQDLLSGDEKIIDIAFKYHYETPEAFSKAFKRFHGFPPSQVRKTDKLLSVAPPLYFSITVKGEKKVEYKIEHKKAFKVNGFSIDTTADKVTHDCPVLWQKIFANGQFEKLQEKQGSLGVLGICYNMNQDQEKLSYLVGIEGCALPDTKTIEIPALQWAVFPGEGELPDDLQLHWQRIFQEWFPSSQYECVDGPQIEVYLDHGDPGRYEVWIPVEVKA